MGFFSRFRRKSKPKVTTSAARTTSITTQSTPKVFSGPVRTTTDVKTFRSTGISTTVQSKASSSDLGRSSGGGTTTQSIASPSDIKSPTQTTSIKPQTVTAPLSKQITPSRTIVKTGSISAAPTTKQQFKRATRERGAVFGSLFFAGEKVQGAFGRAERKFAPRGQSFAGTGIVSTTAQTAPFFTPAGGALALVGTTELIGKQTLTKEGRKGLDIKAEEVKTKTGVPKFVTKTGIIGLEAGAGFLGGRQLKTQTSRALGFPKTQTKVLGQTTSVKPGKVDNTFLVSTEADVLSTQRGLFGGKQTTLGKVESKTILTTAEDTFTTKTVFRGSGVSKKTSLVFPTGKTKTTFSPSKEFQGLSTGGGREIQFTADVIGQRGSNVFARSVKKKGFVSKELTKVTPIERDTTFTLGKSKLTTTRRLGEERPFISESIGLETKGRLTVASASQPLKLDPFKPTKIIKAGRTETVAIIKTTPPKKADIVSTGSGTLLKSGRKSSTSFIKSLETTRVKDITSAGFTTPTKKATGLGKSFQATTTRTLPTAPTSGGVQFKSLTKQTQGVGLGLGTGIKSKAITKTKQGVKTKSRQREAVAFGLKQPSAQRERTAQRTGLAFRTSLVTKQTTKGSGRGFALVTPKATFLSPKGFAPFGFSFSKAPRTRVKRPKTRKGRKAPRREASLAAVGLNIRATKAFRGERTSLGIRPIIVEEKKKKKKKGGKKK